MKSHAIMAKVIGKDWFENTRWFDAEYNEEILELQCRTVTSDVLVGVGKMNTVHVDSVEAVAKNKTKIRLR